MTEARWAAEVRKMNQVFPWFRAIERDHWVGFKGDLKGPKGTVYSVEVLANKNTYPAMPPRIWLRPPFGANRLSDGSLCISRAWRPDRDTFAQQILYAAAYLEYQQKLSELDR